MLYKTLNKFRSRTNILKITFVLSALISLTVIRSGALALVFGVLFSHFIGQPYIRISNKAVGWLLKTAVIGLGFGMTLQSATNTGKEGFTITIVSIAVTLILGQLIGKSLKINNLTTHLISSGTAICGGSAIVAISPIIKASEKQMSVSLGVVFLLNSVALILFPLIGHIFNMSQVQFGLWSAIAIHDTSSVVGAAYEYGEQALQVATTVKMTRVIWIIPLSLVSMLLFRGDNQKITMPWFILLFIAAIAINSYFPLSEFFSNSIVYCSKRILILTLFLIGSGLSIRQLKSVGIKPLILGISLWIAISVGSLIVIIHSF